LQRFAKRRGKWQGRNCCRDLLRGEGNGNLEGRNCCEICEEEREMATCKEETDAILAKR
jgi:hypothetical protein